MSLFQRITPWPAITGLLVAILLVGCSRPDPEQALRDAVGQLHDAIGQRDASALDDWLADDFIGPDGMDRDGARRLALVSFMRYRDVGVTLGPLEIDLQPDHATVKFTAMLTGGSGRLLPQSARVHDVRTGWRLEDGDWRMTSATWTPRL